MSDAVPIPMLLWCPVCSDRHIDYGDFATKPHHTHACQNCGMTWMPHWDTDESANAMLLEMMPAVGLHRDGDNWSVGVVWNQCGWLSGPDRKRLIVECFIAWSQTTEGSQALMERRKA